VCEPPEETWLKIPSGALAWPNELEPQQTTVPPVWTPQEWAEPAETWLKVPAGGLARPLRFKPQQAMIPSVLVAQA
jgi:hypothetical protein